MQKLKLPDITLIIGISVNIVLIIVFVWIYYSTVPHENDLKVFAESKSREIYDPQLESKLSEFRQVEGLPIIIDPAEIGRQDPYGTNQ